jgi:Holliday junction DNA helicase RuvB
MSDRVSRRTARPTQEGERESVSEMLRPQTLAEFSGQPAVSRELGIILGSARQRGAVSDHLLFSGPPGLGKTTLAGIVANELDLKLVLASGPAIERPGDVVSILVGLRSRSLLFIDEIHRLPKGVEEMLYTAMEDRRVDVLIGEQPNTRVISYPLEEFVLVGATTQAGMISAPLRDRFGFTARLRLYDEEALAGIVTRSSVALGYDDETFTSEAALCIAKRGRGTPRVANKWLRRVRDYALTEGISVIDGEVALCALEAFGVDALGLDVLGREILTALCVNFRGGPVGLTTLAASVGEAPGTVEEMYEPYFLERRLITRTPRGRVATAGAWRHLGLDVPRTPELGATLYGGDATS